MSNERDQFLDESVHARLRRLVPPRGLNRFINQAPAEKAEALERQQLELAMQEGYVATRRARAELSEDWAILDIEGWPE